MRSIKGTKSAHIPRNIVANIKFQSVLELTFIFNDEVFSSAERLIEAPVLAIR